MDYNRAHMTVSVGVRVSVPPNHFRVCPSCTIDRFLVAQAIVHNLTIVTPDALIRQYPAKTVW